MGRASAASYILFVVVILITAIQFKLMKVVQKEDVSK
jgi:ABC-type sugar transport system permease subunit